MDENISIIKPIIINQISWIIKMENVIITNVKIKSKFSEIKIDKIWLYSPLMRSYGLFADYLIIMVCINNSYP